MHHVHVSSCAREAGIRAHLDDRSETLKYKIAEGMRLKIPYLAVIGKREAEQGTIALRNARLITMKGDEVIARGDIVITNNRITAIGPSGKVQIPAGAVVRNLSGKTIGDPCFADFVRAEFRRLVAGEIAKWGKVVKAAGTKAD